eukprot:11178364-Lingulodinium_polyedra.AAC.1
MQPHPAVHRPRVEGNERLHEPTALGVDLAADDRVIMSGRPGAAPLGCRADDHRPNVVLTAAWRQC